ncbi:MAG: ROK family transcriptional regulator, partial [Chloroflexi bacterium]
MSGVNAESTRDIEGLRQVNLSAVLSLLRQSSPLSRKELADLTGLNKATITRLVRELIAHGLVREVGLQSVKSGRPSILLRLDPEGGYIIGVGLEVSSCSVILVDFAGEYIWRRDLPYQANDPASSLNCALKLVEEANQIAQTFRRPVLGIGVSAPGLVDNTRGFLHFAPNLGWRDIPLKQIFEDRFSFPVYVDNHANMAALGEFYFGSARDCSYGIYVEFTEGVGGGIIIDQHILAGVTGLAGEVGHTTINPEGPKCNCGNRGCWEAYVNSAALLQRAQFYQLKNKQDSTRMVEQSVQEYQTITQITEGAKAGDPAALEALKVTGYYVGIGLANLINVFNPDEIILGGYLKTVFEFMISEINRV